MGKMAKTKRELIILVQCVNLFFCCPCTHECLTHGERTTYAMDRQVVDEEERMSVVGRKREREREREREGGIFRPGESLGTQASEQL